MAGGLPRAQRLVIVERKLELDAPGQAWLSGTIPAPVASAASSASQYAEIDFDLDNASLATGAVKNKRHDVRRKVEDELGAQPHDQIHGICGADFLPIGVPGLFRRYNAPADFVETANTICLLRYAKQAIDQQFARWIMVHVQSNPLPIRTRPCVLLKGKQT